MLGTGLQSEETMLLLLESALEGFMCLLPGSKDVQRGGWLRLCFKIEAGWSWWWLFGGSFLKREKK